MTTLTQMQIIDAARDASFINLDLTGQDRSRAMEAASIHLARLAEIMPQDQEVMNIVDAMLRRGPADGTRRDYLSGIAAKLATNAKTLLRDETETEDQIRDYTAEILQGRTVDLTMTHADKHKRVLNDLVSSLEDIPDAATRRSGARALLASIAGIEIEDDRVILMGHAVRRFNQHGGRIDLADVIQDQPYQPLVAMIRTGNRKDRDE